MTDDLVPAYPVNAAEGWRSPVVGVMGGVGPAATAVFVSALVAMTDAARDQDHLDAVVLQHATIPDRTAHILGQSDEDPSPALTHDARRLEAWGCDVIVLPCNTAHTYAKAITSAVQVPVLSIVEETAARAARRAGPGALVGVLATAGTRAAGVYEQALEDCGVTAIQPDEADQTRVNRIIYDQVKAGRPADTEMLTGVVDRLCARGASVVILGCTELSVVYAEQFLSHDRRLVDSLDTLVRRTIERAGKRVKR